MSDPLYTYPSPLEGFENLPPLPTQRNDDGKSFFNPPNANLDNAYERFVEPLDNGRRGGFDVHVYFYPSNKEQTAFAQALWERIRRSFPELRIYKIWDRPIGPHVVGMFEVNVFTPAQFGAFIPWLVINRGPLSALVHPNTGEDERDHTQRATWLGEQMPLDVQVLRRFRQMKMAEEALQDSKDSS